MLGLRISKTINNQKTTYLYDGNLLLTEITPTYRNDFLYDENGILYGFIHDYSTKYFYVRDVFQNILGIVDRKRKPCGKICIYGLWDLKINFWFFSHNNWST